MTTHTFTTTAILPSGEEQEVTVTYTYHAVYKGDYYQPPEPPTVEIQSVKPDVGDWDGLEFEAMQDYVDYLADAAEYRAEMRRDEEC